MLSGEEFVEFSSSLQKSVGSAEYEAARARRATGCSSSSSLSISRSHVEVQIIRRLCSPDASPEE